MSEEVEHMKWVIGEFEAALNQIASSHWERVGYDQTDIDDVPDMSSEEAMKLARDVLSRTSELNVLFPSKAKAQIRA